MADSEQLTPKQTAAVAALMAERDVRAAAKATGIGERTLGRWLKQPAFQAALKRAEREALDTAIRRLADLAGEAVTTLADVMQNTAGPAAPRVSAANVALSKLIDLRQLSEIEDRLRRLEELLNVQ